MAGIKNTYQVVAKHHVHPWYSWALMAAAIGFTVGVAYVANQNAQFDSSQAAMRPMLRATEGGVNALPASADQTFIFDELVQNWTIEHGGVAPVEVVIQPATMIIRAGEQNDSVKLGEKVAFLFSQPAQQQAVRRYLRTLREPYDVYFASGANARGYLISPDDWRNTDFQSFANGPDKTALGAITVVQNMCKCNLAGTVGYKDKSATITMNSEKVPTSCNTNSDGNAYCVGFCEGVAKGAAATTVGAEIDPPGNNPTKEEVAKFMKQMEAYLAEATIVYDSLGNTSTCATNGATAKGK